LIQSGPFKHCCSSRSHLLSSLFQRRVPRQLIVIVRVSSLTSVRAISILSTPSSYFAVIESTFASSGKRTTRSTDPLYDSRYVYVGSTADEALSLAGAEDDGEADASTGPAGVAVVSLAAVFAISAAVGVGVDVDVDVAVCV